MSWISLVQYSILGGIEKFYVEATDLHSLLCSKSWAGENVHTIGWLTFPKCVQI